MANNENYIESLTKQIALGKKKESVFNFTFFFVLFGPMIGTLILFGLAIAGQSTLPVWLIWILWIVFIPLIGISLILTQRRELVGSYGETILILIPTFVWLLPGHYKAIETLLIISAIIVGAGLTCYFVAIFNKTDKSQKNYYRKIKRTNILLRMSFVGSSVVSTVSISILLLHWGDTALSIPKIVAGSKDYTSTGWIIFISIVTIAVALLLVFLGLLNNIEQMRESITSNKVTKKKYNSAFMNQTISIKLNKKRSMKRFWRRR